MSQLEVGSRVIVKHIPRAANKLWQNARAVVVLVHGNGEFEVRARIGEHVLERRCREADLQLVR